MNAHSPLPENPPEESPRFCDRCLRPLVDGRGDWYQVTIEAVADPSMPRSPAPQATTAELRRAIEQLVEQLESYSARELEDQVHRRVVLTLCRACYQVWIEDPAGRA